MDAKRPLIGIVGPSKAGKSTLQKGLTQLGYRCRHIAQEHSFVPSMWNVVGKPDVLIYLDVSFENTLHRGQPKWKETDYQEELSRLKQAKEHADLLVLTDHISAEEVLSQVLAFLEG